MPSIFVQGDKQIAYEDSGHGTPIIFIHPPGMGRHVFLNQKSLENDMRVIIPDLSGHGDSSRIKAGEVSISNYSKEMIGFLDALDIESAVFFGYSAGGAIAQNISIHHKSRIKGLILSGGYPAVLNNSLKWEHKMGMYLVKNHRALLTRGLAISHTKNKDLRNILINHMNKAQTDVWCKFYQEVLNMNIIEELSEIEVPLLWMDGTKSDAINRYHTFYRNGIADHRIVFIKHVAHQVPTRKSKIVNEEIRSFIKKLEKNAEKL